ncbi:Thioredoxin-related protein [Pedobacter steynii]|uniref:Thioredoxin-related protein n=1 Tax=Pedobacter steynii TaxID=430522 RepID=A0A1H0IFQ3_9SPHI|nr:thioredoxin fold domain-containing protein [Pedobacter steynii]NQX42886.1 hypothetical protein [Pedobacter steynii]SDO30195.1 Thioredoxin-related protein [Pedobacter steynii]
MISTKLCCCLLLGLLPFMGFAQKNEVAISFGALPDSLAKHPKPILINVYTDWCTYCSMQENGVKKSGELSSLLGKDVYYLRLNAGHKETISFNHEQYHFQPNGPSTGIHELVLALGKGNKEMAYPMWFILDANYKVQYSFSGYLRPKDLNALLLAYLKEEKTRSSDQVSEGIN